MPLKLKHCTLSLRSYGIATMFSDGSICANWPPEDEAFCRLAAEFNLSPLEYVIQHDLSHAFVAEKLFDAPSAVQWAAAQGFELPRVSALYEEQYLYYWQRLVAEKPVFVIPDWFGWQPEWERCLDELKA